MVDKATLKKLVYILSIVVLVSTILFCCPPKAVNADTIKTFDNSDVLKDLEGMTVNGNAFNVADYPKDPYGKIRLLTFAEYCFSQDVSASSNYGLYLYVFNPALESISENNILNKIQMASEFGSSNKPVKYNKFSLKFCSKSSDCLFFKFKVVDKENLLYKLASGYAQENAGKRCYYISGFELLIKGNINATEYSVGKQYVYEGFADGYGNSKDFPLSMTSQGEETLQTTVNYAFYRPEGTTGAYNHTQNQLNSVYFSVPNSLLKKYGLLTAVHMEWYEYMTKEIFVMSNNEALDKLKGFLGEPIEGYDSDVEYGLAVWLTENSSSEGGTTAKKIFNNPRPSMIYCQDEIEELHYLFDLDDLENSVISSEMLLNYIRNYAGTGYKINGKYYAELFEDEVCAGRQKGYNEVNVEADDELSLLNYTFSSSWWQLGWGTHTDNSYSAIKGIYQVTSSDMVGNQRSICDRLFIDSSCYEDFKAEYDNAILEDKTVFLLRYGVTDYSSYPLTVVKKNIVGYGKVDTSGYCAQQTAFLDLDLIDVTFSSESEKTVIPVISSPIEAIGSIKPPVDTSGEKDWLKIVKILLLILALCIFLAPILPYILKAVIWVIILPFKLIANIFKSIKNLSKRE